MRSDPRRGDWLSNVWSYIRSVEEKVLGLEQRVRKLELDAQKSNSKPLRFTTRGSKRPLDED